MVGVRALARLILATSVALVTLGVAPARAQQASPEAAPVKVTPYGVVYFNLFWNESATNNSDVPLWALAGPSSTSASVRQSRFGLRVAGPLVSGAKVSGALEADFFGGFPAVGIGDNMGVLRVRLANVRLDWTRTSLVAGQDWMVFAPLNPVSLASAGIPLMAATGNPWARLPQVRVEHRFGAGLLQGAVLAPSTGDFTAALLYQPSSGALSQQPFVQGRASVTVRSFARTKKPAAFAVSGHYGRSRVVTPIDRTLDSRAVAADWSLPLTNRMLLSGEAFMGQNLAGFQAAVFQGINPDFAVAGPAGLTLDGPRGVGTRGGWSQLAVTITSTVSALATYGLDDPHDRDFTSLTRREARLRNVAVAAAVQHQLSAQIAWALEYKCVVSRLQLAGRQTNDHINLGVTFSF